MTRRPPPKIFTLDWLLRKLAKYPLLGKTLAVLVTIAIAGALVVALA